MPTRGRRAMEEWFRAYGVQQNFRAVKNYIKNGGKKPAPTGVASLALVNSCLNHPDSYLYVPGRYTQEDFAKYEIDVFGEGYLDKIRTVEPKSKGQLILEDMQADKERQELEEKKNPNFEALKLQLL